jgi:rhodanese-related sulfurtransferase
MMADKITAKDLAEKKGDFVLIDVREADEVKWQRMGLLKLLPIFHLDSSSEMQGKEN